MNPSPAFGFVQFELPYAPGPAAGRHLVREHVSEAASYVVVLNEITTTARARRWPRAQRESPNPAPSRLSVWRLTVVDATPLRAAEATESALRARDLRADVRRAAARGERFLELHALAGHQTPRGGVMVADSLAVRVGIGRGDQVAGGRWDVALNVPTNLRASTEPNLAQQQRLAALLTGQDAALACERFVRIARGELAAERTREAALATDTALRAALAELPAWNDQAMLSASLAELAAIHDDVARAADAACHGGLSEDAIATVTAALAALDAALRLRGRPGPG